MNLILIQPEEVQSGQVRLTDRRADHLRKILKVKAGDSVKIGVINGLMGCGEVSAISRQEAVLQIRVEIPPPAKLGLKLILALPRPIMLKRVLAQAASLGIDHLFLINSGRVEKSFFDASPVKDGDFLPFLLKGLEQAVDTVPPTVSVHPRFKPFVEDILPGLAEGRKLIAHPDSGPDLAGFAPPASVKLNGPTLLAIGPEGGWLDYEVAKFLDGGFQTFSLGPRILRVDTAVPAITAQIALLQQMEQAPSSDKG